MSSQPPMHCPECGENAISRPPADPTPWQAHGIPPPQWSHSDGSSLCPVIGPAGGYQPAQPQPRHAITSTADARPRSGQAQAPAASPPTPGPLASPDRPAGPPDLRPPARKADSVGTRYMRRMIAGLTDPARTAQPVHRRAVPEIDRDFPEPEAGA